MTVNNILRPVLLSSTQHYTEKGFGQFLEEISTSSAGNGMDVAGIGENALQKYQQANEKIQRIAEQGSQYNAAYKMITTTLSVATSVVAPWLELVIIFLPDIVRFFSARNQESELRNKVNNNIIPQIIMNLRPEVEKSLEKMKDDMVEVATEEIIQLIDMEMDAIRDAKIKKENAMKWNEAQMSEVEDDINRLNHMLEEIM